MNTLVKSNSNGKNLMFPEFPSLFDDFLMRDFFNLSNHNGQINTSTLPAVNIKDKDTAFELEMAIPGMDKKDFKISLEDHTLVISAQNEIKTEEKTNDSKYTRREFSYQSFTRTFQLPENAVNENEISASYNNGILNISIPKIEQANTKTTKEIAIA